MKKTNVLLAMILVVTLLLGGCGADATNQEDQTSETSTVVNEEAVEKDSLKMVYNSVTNSLDPYETVTWNDQDVFINIYDPLIGFDPATGTMALKLAKDMNISEDGLTYDFTIREDVVFSNGKPLTIEDIVFSYEKAIASPKTNTKLGSITSVEKVNDQVFRINLSEPYASFKSMLAYVFIVNKEAYEASAGDAVSYGDSIENYVGTGAYKPVEWEKGVSMKLVSNPAYFDDTPKLKTIVIDAINDDSTATLALESGDVDFIVLTEGEQLPILEANDDITLFGFPGTELDTLIMNLSKEPFNNYDFRMAIAYATDRESIITADGGYNMVWNNYLESGSSGLAEDAKAPSYDLDKAKEHLQKSGYEGAEITYLAKGSVPLSAEILQADLAEIGVKMNIEVMELGAAYDKIFAGDYDLSNFIASNVSYDADMLYRWYSGNSSLNLIHGEDTTFDNYLADARRTINEDERNALYEKAQYWVQDNCLIVPRFMVISHSAYANGVKNYTPRPDSHIEYLDLSW